MENNLQLCANQDLLNLNGANDELGELISIYKIQYASNNGYKRGYITSTAGIEQESVSFIWLAMSMSRILWASYDPKESNPKPLCKSNDGVNPTSGITMRSGECQYCQDSMWINNKPPLCSKVFNLLCWDTIEQIPFIFGIKRTGIKSLKLLKSDIKRKSKNATNNGIPTHCKFIINLRALPEGTYYVPTFTIVDNIKQGDVSLVSSIVKKIVPEFVQIVDPEIVQ